MRNNTPWSSAQTAVIEGEGNMLVSASAGSGKTATMIEKICRLIERGVPLDKMFVATYTVAAAEDMRYKLAVELEKGDERCKAALETLPNAEIGTLHSLCSRLIRTRFYLTDADPAFEMLSEQDAALMKNQAVDAVLARGGDDCFTVVYDALLQARSDKPIKRLILDTVDFVRTQPDPDGWLDGCLRLYDDPAAVAAELNAYTQAEREELRGRVRALAVDTQAADFARNVPLCYTLSEYLDGGQLPPRATGRVDPLFADLNERYKACLDDVKAFRDEAERRAGLPDAGDARREAALFVQLVRDTAAAYDALKAEKGALDYADLEHKALEILRAGVDVPYTHVFVDEYQDINPLQEEIVNLLARNATLFQVGDVKQSIYAFRLCDPSIFLRRYAAYTRGEGGKAYELNTNYRSDGGVLDAANRVFDRLMTPSFGGIDYRGTARLQAGRPVRTPDAVTFRIVTGEDKPVLPPVYRVESDGGCGVDPEAALVARDIRALLESSRGNHPVRPEQIAVIMRSRTQLLYAVADALELAGIECAVCAKESPAQSDAVRPLLNALRLIDNRDDDIMLAAVLLSPFGGFTAEELAEIPVTDRFTPSVMRYRGRLSDKLDAFFAKFDEYERLAWFLPADELAGKVASDAHYFEYLYAQSGGRTMAAEAGAFLAAMSASGHCAQLADYIEYALNAPPVERVTGAGAVKLMTAHASKGLEFDYVFFVGAETKFRLSDADRTVNPDREWGLGVKRFDFSARRIESTKLTELIRLRQKKKMLEEEMRILYVALTRAKERLYIYGKRGKQYEGGDLAPTSNLNFLLPALSNVEYVDPSEVKLTPPTFTRVLSRADAALVREIGNRLAARPAPRTEPQKTTVTKLATDALDETEAAVEAEYVDTERAPKGAGGDAATQKGTAYHLMMEHIDFKADFAAEWERLCRKFPLESALCDRADIEACFAIVGKLAEGYTLYREQPFIAARDGLLVQGVIDLLLVKGDEAVVLDYKTTRADVAALAHKKEYLYQTALYASAVERLLGRNVTGVYLYSFYKNCLIEMPYKG